MGRPACVIARAAQRAAHMCWSLQAVSSRPDVTPPDYLKELEKLQDQIPPFPDAEAMKVQPACTHCAGNFAATALIRLSFHQW